MKNQKHSWTHHGHKFLRHVPFMAGGRAVGGEGARKSKRRRVFELSAQAFEKRLHPVPTFHPELEVLAVVDLAKLGGLYRIQLGS